MNGDIEQKLKKLAENDWGKFTEILGQDALIVVSARLLRKEGKSWREISIKLSITPRQAQYACKKIS